ncbi:MAG: hypothetical protein OXM61_03695 [Candidatus Poribacteria bacterium]|nr:hypothetical protein [Candidatus Poribacteria bacterium]
MGIDEDRKRLAQTQVLEELLRELRLTEMVPVYQIDRDGLNHERFIYSALIPNEQIEQALSDSDWDLNIGDGLPASVYGGGRPPEYLRYGVENGIEPLVIYMGDYYSRDAWVEICEEFRHFHHLYHDTKTHKYLKIDEDYEEVIVAIVRPSHVEIRLKEILQWLSLKEMHLAIQFRCWERSEHSPEELGLNHSEIQNGGSEVWATLHRKDFACWRHSYGKLLGIQNYQVDSKLEVKRLIEPLPKSESGYIGFSEGPKRRHVEFIVNAYGDEHTCDPNKLNEFLGENSGVAWKHTPIYFRRQVLEKYYNEPSKYSVKDSMVSCKLWNMKIDNHSSDKVCVFLDHLGIHLPYSEQLHWRAHNILPEGGVSKTFYRRNVLGEWASSDQPEHLFKQNYEQLRKACDECLDWQLLKPLDSGDEYRLQRLRDLTVDEESHFKDSVLDLANILIERLNEEQLKNLIPVDIRENKKRGIDRLKYVLDSRKIMSAEKHIIFLRCLWDLRITRGGSHPELLEDSRYKRASAHFDLENLNRQEAFTKILEEAVEFLDFLISVVRSGKLSEQNSEDSETD